MIVKEYMGVGRGARPRQPRPSGGVFYRLFMLWFAGPARRD